MLCWFVPSVPNQPVLASKEREKKFNESVNPVKPFSNEKPHWSELMNIRLKEHYNEDIVPALIDILDLSNVMQVPKLKKIVLNIGLGEAIDNAKALDAAVDDISIIAGQRPVITRARKSIANFKLREGKAIGVKVTLRGERMWSFLDRLMSIALPRVRDFRGVSPNSFDGRGNYSLGFHEQLVFPEVSYDDIDKVRGFEVTIVTTAKTDEEGLALLTLLGMPFKKMEG
jgi:large subunit ribosomal protein L5